MLHNVALFGKTIFKKIFVLLNLNIYLCTYLYIFNGFSAAVGDDNIYSQTLSVIIYFFVQCHLQAKLSVSESEVFADKGTRQPSAFIVRSILKLKKNKKGLCSSIRKKESKKTGGGDGTYLFNN